MSVQKIGASKWVTRWYEGEKQRSKTFAKKADAKSFEALMRTEKQQGILGARPADRTLDQFMEEWVANYSLQFHKASTRKINAGIYDRDIGPYFGSMPLREITVRAVDEFKAYLLKKKAAGADPQGPSRGGAVTHRTLVLLQGMLQQAVVWGYLEQNPVAAVSKRVPRREAAGQAFSAEQIEALRAVLLRKGDHRSAAMVSVMVYVGLRPGELRALRWGDVSENTIHVRAAASSDQVGGTKTGVTRSPFLPSEVREELAQWRHASGHPDVDAFVFPNTSGRLMTDNDWRNWSRRVFKPAAREAGLGECRPYDLRHSFGSFHLYSGSDPAWIAREMGNSVVTFNRYYAHVMKDLSAGNNARLDEAVRNARKTGPLPNICQADPLCTKDQVGILSLYGKPTSGFEPLTPSLRVKCSTS